MKMQRNFTQREEVGRLQAVNERLRFFDKVSNELVSSFDLLKTLNNVSDFIVPYFADFSNMAIVDEKGKIVEMIPRHVDPKKTKLVTQLVKVFQNSPAEVGTGHILRIGKTQYIPDISATLERIKEVHPQAYEIVCKLSPKSYIGVPILLGEKVIGAITFASTKTNYTKDDLVFTQELAKRIARAVENARLYQSAEKKWSFLARASKLLASSLDFQTTLKNVAHMAVPEVADWCMIDLKDEKGNLLDPMVVNIDPKKSALGLLWRKKYTSTSSLRKEAFTASVIRTGKPVYVPYLSDEAYESFAKNKEQLAIIKELDFRSLIIMPLKVRGETIGCITLGVSGTRQRYKETDMPMVEELASRASVAIENARLHQRARKAISVRDEFMSIASHELRTPITSVKMYAQFLRRLYEKSSKSGLLNYFEQMDTEVDKMSTLIGDLLDVSRIERGNFELNMSTFSLDDEVKKGVQITQASTDKHTLRIEGKVGRQVYGDTMRISQVLTNLLTNAVKYSPKGGEIIVKLARHKEGAYVSVQDFGIGINEEDLENLFDPFYRVGGAEKEANISPGMGIGLYVSSEIMRKHGSRINVESSKGEGSTFSFILPYA